ncbi:hypothetical protein [Pseudobacteriovorax antillogorgiicola]|uniref:Phosphate-selective porin O and P n=1 Tax=Pseudobacteriovorax antillogorgiicola TaxID=1513793 RepID=A0A1Y6CMC0_9BACT|nr:hypothetical protein [Pseudobacteriovorax antillogorgiicola]TCS45003.1 hypothetical protein EDD56_13040 [Pseudobacteriovorax antillogorgiicola]SMF76472.1 hypothetical protein SAMN06296036_13034 [Pseudobacteriovorax antillogorgiicola]
MLKFFKMLRVWCLLLISIPASAQELDYAFETARIRGRGGTYAAQYYGNQSPRFNPATLAEDNAAFQLRPLEINLSVGRNVVSTINDVVGHDFGKSDTDAVIEFIRKFENKFGDRHLGRFELELLAMRVLSVEVMPFVKNQTYIELRRPTTPQFDYIVDTQTGIYIAYGLSLGGVVKLGFGLKPMFRTVTTGQLIFTDVLDLENTDIEAFADTTQGNGIGGDLSALWTPIARFRLGLIVENVGDMGYFDSDDAPSNIRQKSSLGFLWRYPMSSWNLDILGDVQDMENRDGKHWSRLFHWGAEIGTKAFSKDHDYGAVVGINDGYGTWGLFADLWIARLEIAQYSVELDRNPGSREDARYGISLRTSMTF